MTQSSTSPFESRSLNAQELATVRLWQCRMIQIFIIAMFSLFAVVGLDLIFQPGETLGTAMLAGLLIVVLVAARIQFSQKCPACGARLGFQTRLLLPPACKRCGVSFREAAPS